MPRGRKPFADKRVRREMQIPESIALRIDVLAHDPLRGKPAHGKWSEIVSEALREWLDRRAGIGAVQLDKAEDSRDNGNLPPSPETEL